jgi:hypothetical protein
VRCRSGRPFTAANSASISFPSLLAQTHEPPGPASRWMPHHIYVVDCYWCPMALLSEAALLIRK